MADSSENKSLDQIEREADEARGRLAETLSELKVRLAPDTLKQALKDEVKGVKDDAFNYVGGSSMRRVADLRERAESNPVALALIGAGLAWPAWRIVRHVPIPAVLVGAGVYALMRGSVGANGSRDAYTDPNQGYVPGGVAGYGYPVESEPPHPSVGDRVQEFASNVGETVTDAAARARDAAQGAATQVTDAVGRVGSAVSDAVSRTAAEAGDAARGAAAQVRGAAEGAAAQASDLPDRARSAASDLVGGSPSATEGNRPMSQGSAYPTYARDGAYATSPGSHANARPGRTTSPGGGSGLLDQASATVGSLARQVSDGASGLAAQASRSFSVSVDIPPGLVLGTLGVLSGMAIASMLRSSGPTETPREYARPVRRFGSDLGRTSGRATERLSEGAGRLRTTAASTLASAASGAAETGSDVAEGARDLAGSAGSAIADTARRAYEAALSLAYEAGALAADAGNTVSNSARRAYDAALDRASDAADLAAGAGSTVTDAARRAYESGLESAYDAGHRAASLGERARTSVAELTESQPVILAALGLLIGAGVGAALPLTDAENRLMGEPSDALKAKAAALAADQLDDVREAVERTVSDLADQAKEGLSGMTGQAGSGSTGGAAAATPAPVKPPETDLGVIAAPVVPPSPTPGSAGAGTGSAPRQPGTAPTVGGGPAAGKIS